MRKQRGARPVKRKTAAASKLKRQSPAQKLEKARAELKKLRNALERARRAKAKQLPRTELEIAKAFRAQRIEARERVKISRAKAARDAYKPRKKDRGKIVLVGIGGQRDPQAHGKKGYAVYVTRTGKKRLLIVKGAKDAYEPKQIRYIELPAAKNLRKKVEKFQKSQLEVTATGKEVIKGKGKINISSKWDFNERVVHKLAKSIQKALLSQRSKRVMTVEAMVSVKLPDGASEVYEIRVKIERADHVAIRLGGIVEFVRRKFYAAMAKRLAYDGYVSSGSYNHIRGLTRNAFLTKKDWHDDTGESWAGIYKEVVRIEAIEWKIKQVK